MEMGECRAVGLWDSCEGFSVQHEGQMDSLLQSFMNG